MDAVVESISLTIVLQCLIFTRFSYVNKRANVPRKKSMSRQKWERAIVRERKRKWAKKRKEREVREKILPYACWNNLVWIRLQPGPQSSAHVSHYRW